jgi:hypothetical protein
MKTFLRLLLAALALAVVACEKHPLPGEPPVHSSPRVHAEENVAPITGEQHAGGKIAQPDEARDASAQPASQPPGGEGAKPAEPRKFFPETPEKK